MKKRIDIIIHILIIILEILAFIRAIRHEGRIAIEFYTDLSNLIALITSILYLIFRNNNKIVNNMYFITASMLSITLLVVIFVLGPMYSFDYKWLILQGSHFIMHFICPLLFILVYLFYKKRNDNKYLPMIVTVIYGIVLIILNILKVVDGPYPFLKVYKQSIMMSILWGIILISGSLIISILLIKLNKKVGGYYEHKIREGRKE